MGDDGGIANGVLKMEVKALFTRFNEITGAPEGHDHVATFTVDCRYVENALAMAWRAFQNLDGSWSQGEMIFDDRGCGWDNPDYDERIEVIKPLAKDYRGQVYGHRSAMIGDIFEIDGEQHRVASFGFDRL